jgi:hypothetical protein
MSYRHRPVIVHNLIWLSMFSMGGLVSARGSCFNTPAAAAYSIKPGSSAPPTMEGGGYRVTSIEADPVSGQRWAMISSCDHPERPAFSLQIEGSDSAEHSLPSEPQTVIQSAHLIPVIHVGDSVRLWRQEAALRIELAAVAEENGSLGKLIRVRLLRRNTDDQSITAEFNGIVRGKSDVEMQP